MNAKKNKIDFDRYTIFSFRSKIKKIEKIEKKLKKLIFLFFLIQKKKNA